MIGRGAVVFAAGVVIALAAPAKISRVSLKALENTFDQRIARADINEPFDLLGPTRAIYVNNAGVVLSAEVNLVVGPAITPFRPKLNTEEVEKLRQRKLARLPVLKQLMRDLMVTSATKLNTLPPEEQIVVGMNLFFYSWEDRKQLPEQIVMRAPRKVLLEVEAGKAQLDAVVEEQAF